MDDFETEWRAYVATQPQTENREENKFRCRLFFNIGKGNTQKKVDAEHARLLDEINVNDLIKAWEWCRNEAKDSWAKRMMDRHIDKFKALRKGDLMPDNEKDLDTILEACLKCDEVLHIEFFEHDGEKVAMAFCHEAELIIERSVKSFTEAAKNLLKKLNAEVKK